MKKTHIALAALAIAICVAPLAKTQAASLLNAASKPSVESLGPVVKARMAKKRHMRRHKHKRKAGRQARSRGPGRCGENMYWSSKKGTCMDARNKA
jgi:hypothetical protein